MFFVADSAVAAPKCECREHGFGSIFHAVKAVDVYSTVVQPLITGRNRIGGVDRITHGIACVDAVGENAEAVVGDERVEKGDSFVDGTFLSVPDVNAYPGAADRDGKPFYKGLLGAVAKHLVNAVLRFGAAEKRLCPMNRANRSFPPGCGTARVLI